MCDICKNPKGKPNHTACLEACGLDYDPKSRADATDWLKRRRRILATVAEKQLCRAHQNCYTAIYDNVSAGFILGYVTRDEAGYHPCPHLGIFKTDKQAQKKAAEYNQALDVTRTEAFEIVGSSMAASRVADLKKLRDNVTETFRCRAFDCNSSDMNEADMLHHHKEMGHMHYDVIVKELSWHGSFQPYRRSTQGT